MLTIKKKTALLFCFWGLFFGFFFLFSLPEIAWATKFSLSLPPGPFNRDQVIQATVNIDAEGLALTSATTLVHYDTNYLEYQSTSLGTFFPRIAAVKAGPDIVQITGSVSSGDAGKSGTGIFAKINFKIIAEAAGSTTFCTILSISPTPAVASPTPIATPRLTVAPTSPPEATAVPEVPLTGHVENLIFLILAGIIFLGFGTVLFKR